MALNKKWWEAKKPEASSARWPCLTPRPAPPRCWPEARARASCPWAATFFARPWARIRPSLAELSERWPHAFEDPSFAPEPPKRFSQWMQVQSNRKALFLPADDQAVAQEGIQFCTSSIRRRTKNAAAVRTNTI